MKTVSFCTTMVILYLASYIATSDVRFPGLLVVSLSNVPMGNCYLMAFSSLLTFHCRRKMESNRADLGSPGDRRSGMSICIDVHVMKAACK